VRVRVLNDGNDTGLIEGKRARARAHADVHGGEWSRIPLGTQRCPSVWRA